jgi:hypothetical protein
MTMKPMFRRVASLIALTVVAFAASADAKPAAKSIAWQTDFTKAKAAASKQKKIIMIDFYTEG